MGTPDAHTPRAEPENSGTCSTAAVALISCEAASSRHLPSRSASSSHPHNCTCQRKRSPCTNSAPLFFFSERVRDGSSSIDRGPYIDNADARTIQQIYGTTRTDVDCRLPICGKQHLFQYQKHERLLLTSTWSFHRKNSAVRAMEILALKVAGSCVLRTEHSRRATPSCWARVVATVLGCREFVPSSGSRVGCDAQNVFFLTKNTTNPYLPQNRVRDRFAMMGLYCCSVTNLYFYGLNLAKTMVSRV